MGIPGENQSDNSTGPSWSWANKPRPSVSWAEKPDAKGAMQTILDAVEKRNAAKKRSEEISLEMENAQGNPDEFANLRDSAVQGIDASWHNAGQDTAESYARRGLGGSGMDSGDQYRLASKRASAVDDATMKARAAAIANQRADLAQEQTALVGLQTSDINAQRLAMEKQAYQDQILADAIAALSQVGVQHASGANSQMSANSNADYVAQQRLAGWDPNNTYGVNFPRKIGP